MILEEIKSISRTNKELSKFGLTVGIFLVFVGGLFFWLEKQSYPYFLAIGTVLILGGLVVPKLPTPIYLAWMAFATVMGWVMTRVILTVVFFLVFTPIGFFGRLFGYKFLDLKWDASQGTYWNRRKSTDSDKWAYERQF